MEKWNYDDKWNYMHLAKVKMDPRKRKLQEAFTCTRGTFLPLSCLGSTHLTQMPSTCRFTGGTTAVPTIPLTPFYKLLGLACGCSLSTAIHPGTVWYQGPIPAGKPDVSLAWAAGLWVQEQAGLGALLGAGTGLNLLCCLSAELLVLTQLETKARQSCLCCIPQAKPLNVIPTSWSCHFVLPTVHKGDSCASITCSSYNIFPGKGRFALWIFQECRNCLWTHV